MCCGRPPRVVDNYSAAKRFPIWLVPACSYLALPGLPEWGRRQALGLPSFRLHRHCLLSEPPALQSGLPGTPHLGLRGLACCSCSHPELSEMAPGVGQVLWDPGEPAGWSSGSCTLKSQPGRSTVSEESSRGRLGKEGKGHFRAAYAKMPMENVVDTLKCYPTQWLRHML